MQRLFAQQIVRQDYDWQRENSEKESLWNNAMLIELEDFFYIKLKNYWPELSRQKNTRFCK